MKLKAALKIINREELKKEMPEIIRKASCDCDRREWMRSKMITEMVKALDNYLHIYGLPNEIALTISK